MSRFGLRATVCRTRDYAIISRISANSSTTRSQTPLQLRSHDEFFSHSTELLLFLGHSLVSPERPHGLIEQAEVKKSGFKSGFCHFTVLCLSGSDITSVPQFPHVYVTWFSSLNVPWAKTESPVPQMLVPAPLSYRALGPCRAFPR